MNEPQCPASRELEMALLGLLPDGRNEWVEAHLLECAACVSTVRTLQPEDILVTALQAQPEVTERESKCERQIEDLIEHLSSTGSGIINPAEAKRSCDTFAELADSNSQETSPKLTVAQIDGAALNLPGYTILGELGRGGMGVVYEAEDVSLKRRVAVKVLGPESGLHKSAGERFLREAQTAAAVRHDHVVTIFQVSHNGETPFIVMELLEGESLDARLNRTKRLSTSDVLRIGRQIAEGLAAAHGRELLHRDIKPANIWLESRRDRVKILDFGLARPVSGDSHLTREGTAVGTPAYMAPEQARGGLIDSRADLFSLGCVLYRAITGRLPFRGATPIDTIVAKSTETPPTPKSLNEAIPSSLSDLIMQLLAKNPDNRPASAIAVAEALEGCEQSLNSSAVGQAAGAPPRSRRPRAWIAAAAGAFLLLGVVVIIKNREGKEVGRINVDVPSGGTVEVQTVPQEPKKNPVATTPSIAPSATPSGSRAPAAAALAKKPPLNQTPSSSKETKPWASAAFKQWMSDVQALPAEQQITAVSKKLMELNPGFDGKVIGKDVLSPPKVENGVVTEFGIRTDEVTDISPIKALSRLKILSCGGTGSGRFNKLSDLSPLTGMSLSILACQYTQVSDLSPLKGMQLGHLGIQGTRVTDLSPIQGMPLISLVCDRTSVVDLSPLHDCKKLTKIMVTSTSVTAAGVAALQRSLPGCIIEWDDPSKTTPPATLRGATATLADPKFQAWLTATQALSAEEQIKAVSKKLIELNPGFDGAVGGRTGEDSPKIENGVVTAFFFYTDKVTDITPLLALDGLKYLSCGARENSKLVDLSAIQGMPLTTLNFYKTSVTDLSPLKGMPLTNLQCQYTPVFDLSPLADCKNLRTVISTSTKVTPAAVAALKKALPNCNIEWDDPSKTTPPATLRGATATLADPKFQAWLKATQALPAEQQIAAVSKKLMELNPGFDGKLMGKVGQPPKIDNGVFKELSIVDDNVTDLSPMRAMPELKLLYCSGSGIKGSKGKLSDLSPLQGMSLTYFGCPYTLVTDLSPLKGMPLTVFNCQSSLVTDLSPLRGMPLTTLQCMNTNVTDLTPLNESKSLTALNVSNSRVTPATIAALQKALPNCKIEWDEPGKSVPPDTLGGAAAIMADPAFQAWIKATQALPAAEQINAVSKKLVELNPGFDGVLTDRLGVESPKIEGGAVTELRFNSNDVTDVSPVRAFKDVRHLVMAGTSATKRKLTDISPLQGLKLEYLSLSATKVSDLSPLQGMPLKSLSCSGTLVVDLSPLETCSKLQSLIIRDSPVTATSVAALQKTLPDCKIEWDAPGRR